MDRNIYINIYRRVSYKRASDGQVLFYRRVSQGCVSLRCASYRRACHGSIERRKCKLQLLSEWGSRVNGLLELSTAGELHSYIDIPETPQISYIYLERAESIQDKLYLSRIDRICLE